LKNRELHFFGAQASEIQDGHLQDGGKSQNQAEN
jgi:hypothetical protein